MHRSVCDLLHSLDVWYGNYHFYLEIWCKVLLLLCHKDIAHSTNAIHPYHQNQQMLSTLYHPNQAWEFTTSPLPWPHPISNMLLYCPPTPWECSVIDSKYGTSSSRRILSPLFSKPITHGTNAIYPISLESSPESTISPLPWAHPVSSRLLHLDFCIHLFLTSF